MTQLKHIDQPLKRLFSYLTPFRKRFYTSIITSALNKVLDLMPPLLVAWVIDSVSGQPPGWIVGITGSRDPLHLAGVLAILAFLIFGFESVFQWAYNYGFMTLSQKMQHQLRLDTYEKLQGREIAFFENHRLGNTLSILNDDVNQLERFLNQAFNEIVQLVVMVIFATYVMFTTSWQLAVIALIPVPFVIIGSLYYQKKVSPRYAKIREAVGSLVSRLENNLAGILVIKSFTAEKFELQRVDAASNAYQKANIDAIKLNAVYVPLIRTAIAIGFAAVLFIGSYWILEGKDILTVGELVFFAMMIQRLLWPLTRMGTVLDESERARASAKRVFGLLDSTSQITDPKDPVNLSTVKGDVSFNNVGFHYDNNIPILTSLSYVAQAGETIGIAGMTGSGKSTLIKCLMRLYDVKEGRVQIDGVDIRDLTLKQLRHNIALVSQDVYLFHGTIYENIAYGIEQVTKEDVIQAATLAQLDSFIDSLPKGYDSIVGEKGIKLSGGQRQRLSIARAILKSAPIMVFDEATSSVDTETERAIQKNINRLTEGKTALVIAHRLSTIRHADRIIVLGNGTIVEEGTHDSLLEKQGHYADLWKIQVGSTD